MKWRRLAKGMLAIGALLVAAFVGAKVGAFLTNPPVADLSDIKFRFWHHEESKMPVVEVYYVTSRRPVDGKSGEFSDESANSLSYGIAQIRMPAGLRVGDVQMPEIPRRAIDDRHAVVLEVKPLSEADFRTALETQLARLNTRTFDLFIHGINHSFDSAIRQAGTLSFDLDMPQPMVVFSWATTAGILPGAYEKDRAQVTPAARQLANFLEKFQHSLDLKKLNVVAHSLGCKVACETFDLLVHEDAWNNSQTEFSNIVLAAPDVSSENFDAKFVEDIAAISKRVTIYVSRNDGVLVLSSFLNGQARVGEFGEAEAALQMLFRENASAAPHIQIVDATFVNNFLNAHSCFYQSRPAFHDLYNLLRNDLPAEERHLLRHEKAGQANYWVLRP